MVSGKCWRRLRQKIEPATMTRYALAALVALSFGTPAVCAQEYGPARSALERFSTDLEQLHARFTQTVVDQGGVLMDSGEGEVWVSRPNLFRWAYAGDFPELIVADGERVWLFDEALDQVTVKVQSGLAEDSPLMLLTDLGSLDEQFLVAELGQYEDMELLELSSSGSEAQFDRVILGLVGDELRMMALEDAFGMRTEIQFEDIRRNPGLAAELFEFIPPEGVDVIGDDVNP
jgi:outer membrane lipoprotein carrier protein